MKYTGKTQTRKRLCMAFAAGICLLQANVAKASLVGFYPFNGNALDSSGNGNNGTVSGPLTYTNNGPFGGEAITFAGDNSTTNGGGINTPYVSVPIDTAIEDVPIGGGETFGGWFNIAPGASTCCNRGLISSDDGNFDPTIDVDTRTAGFSYAGFIGGSLVGLDAPANSGVWTFVAISYTRTGATSGGYTFVVDGDSMTGSTGFDYGGVEGTTYLGINPNFDYELNGEIADAFFYNNALTLAQLQGIESGGPDSIVGTPSSVPEPATFALLGLGLFGVAAARRRWR